MIKLAGVPKRPTTAGTVFVCPAKERTPAVTFGTTGHTSSSNGACAAAICSALEICGATGDATAPAARCRNLRRGNFMCRLPGAHQTPTMLLGARDVAEGAMTGRGNSQSFAGWIQVAFATRLESSLRK